MARDEAQRGHTSGGRLAWTRRIAWTSLFLERLWPTVFAALCLVAGFLTLAWFGFFAVLPGWARITILALFGAAALLVLWRARGLHLPHRADVDRRIERESHLEHQPLQAQSDRPSVDDPYALALWRAHQRRMAERLKALRGGAPETRTERLDPHGLRAMLVLFLVTAFAFSYGAGGGRITDAFAPVEGSGGIVAARVDAWVTPPGYTGRAPIFLTGENGAAAEEGPVSAPEDSVLSVRISDGSSADLTFYPADGSEAVPIPAAGEAPAEEPAAEQAAENEGEAAPATPPSEGEYEFTLAESGTVKLEQGLGTLGEWSFVVQPDENPTIAFEGEPLQALNGAMEISYVISDDYGVSDGRAEIVVMEDLADGARALTEPPKIDLVMPRRAKGEARGRTNVDLTESPYAGALVEMTLVATDDAGQVGRSETKTFRLPERRFTNPLARAVVEQRRMLALDANAAPRVVDMLDAITFRGADFIENPTDHMMLQAVRTRIADAFDDETLISAVDFMWDIALGIEDGDLSLAEQRLRDARERLSEALENGASDEEIDRLMEELRQAMQEYMQALAEAMQNQPPMNQQQMGDMQMLTPQDLNEMLDRIEDLAKSGSKDAAQQLLSELQSMMDNLQAMRPGQQQGGEQSAMQQQMNELGEMLRRQQELMDETFRLGREQMQQQQQGPFGQPQQGQQGQPQQGGEGQEGAPMTAEELKEALERLQAQQGQLQEDLKALQQELQGMGMQPGEGFDEAGEAMGRAEDALGEGDDGEAVGQQGQAMEALRRGAQDMMQQMQQAMQGQQGQQGQMGQGYGRGRPGPSGRDPLGRPRATQGPSFGQDVEVPDEIDAQRAREILDAIRERLGDALSPQLEREYLERLLQTP